jgi:hypothetical protein
MRWSGKKALRDRSAAIQQVVEEKLARLDRSRLARESPGSIPKPSRLKPTRAYDAILPNGPILRGEIRWADLNPERGQEQAGIKRQHLRR